MAVPAPFSTPTRWSRTIASTAFACTASLALHAVALGGLAWLYRSSGQAMPVTLDVRIASVYLAPSVPTVVPPAPLPVRETVEPARAPQPAKVAKAVAPSASAPEIVTTAPRAEPLSIPVASIASPDDTGAPPMTSSASPDAGLAVEWRVQDWLAQHRQYPRAARRSGAEGTVWVRFVLDRAGALQGSEILESSGHSVLDRAALDLLERAAPFPALPSDLAMDEIELVLPIEYDLSRPARG